jgi:Flp pilus assembly protein TadG
MRCRFRDDRGSATAELAVALPAVVLVLACCISGLQVAGQHLRLQDAAALAAGALARGDPPEAAVSRLAPGARVAWSAEDDLVCATVTARASTALLPGIDLKASSCALDGGR